MLKNKIITNESDKPSFIFPIQMGFIILSYMKNRQE